MPAGLPLEDGPNYDLVHTDMTIWLVKFNIFNSLVRSEVYLLVALNEFEAMFTSGKVGVP